MDHEMSDYLERISEAVAKGETESQTAIPDGVFLGEFYFITNKNNKIIIVLAWTGERWIAENEVFNIQGG